MSRTDVEPDLYVTHQNNSPLMGPVVAGRLDETLDAPQKSSKRPGSQNRTMIFGYSLEAASEGRIGEERNFVTFSSSQKSVRNLAKNDSLN